MRPVLLLALVVALGSAPGGAQSVIQLDSIAPEPGPNARAGQRPLGPNARAGQRPLGPNAALARQGERPGEAVYFPSCAAAGVVRATPIRRGEPGYGRHLDRDGDGVACE